MNMNGLQIFSPMMVTNHFQNRCHEFNKCECSQEILENGHFQTILLLTIIASTIQLLFESPIKSQVLWDIRSMHFFCIPWNLLIRKIWIFSNFLLWCKKIECVTEFCLFSSQTVRCNRIVWIDTWLHIPIDILYWISAQDPLAWHLLVKPRKPFFRLKNQD